MQVEIARVHAENFGVYGARKVWRQLRREGFEVATLEWVDWFNHRRLLEPIGNVPPAEAKATYYDALETADMAA